MRTGGGGGLGGRGLGGGGLGGGGGCKMTHMQRVSARCAIARTLTQLPMRTGGGGGLGGGGLGGGGLGGGGLGGGGLGGGGGCKMTQMQRVSARCAIARTLTQLPMRTGGGGGLGSGGPGVGGLGWPGGSGGIGCSVGGGHVGGSSLTPWHCVTLLHRFCIASGTGPHRLLL
jgi:hypothetical protein